MLKDRLNNGATLIFEKNNSKSVAVEVMFNVGSNYETKKEAGLSHFLEHMLFEGTKKRKSSGEIANEIEKYGAEFNAYTTGDRTAFFIKIINKRFDIALDILSDMIKSSGFGKKIIEKEKKVVLKEINMVTDDPRLHQWILFQKTLFEKHPAKNPTYGTVEAVKNFARDDVVGYYKGHYVPNNMIISVVGNVGNVKKNVEKYFGSLKPGKVIKRSYADEPLQTKAKKFVEKKKTLNSYMVLGYKTVPWQHKDSYVFDVISAILGRGQSGWMFNEIRNKRGLAYQVGVNVEEEYDYGTFAVYAGLDKKKIEKAKEIMLQQFKRLQKLTKKELEEAKTYIEGNHTLQMEDNFQSTDNLAVWESLGDVGLADYYLKNIRKVTVDDARRVAKKYFNDKYTLVVIEQE